MREVKIIIPDGYAQKVIAWLVTLGVLLAAAPYYGQYLERVNMRTEIEKARAQIEAKQILGECK